MAAMATMETAMIPMSAIISIWTPRFWNRLLAADGLRGLDLKRRVDNRPSFKSACSGNLILRLTLIRHSLTNIAMPDFFAGRGRIAAGGGAEVGDDGAAPLEPRQPHGHRLVGAL